jgi:hypothetical protein
MRKHDPVSLATANLLFKSLNINMEQYILKLQKINNQQKKAAAVANVSLEDLSNHNSKAPFAIKKGETGLLL